MGSQRNRESIKVGEPLRTAPPPPAQNPAMSPVTQPGNARRATLIFQSYNVFIGKFLSNSKSNGKNLPDLDSNGKITPKAMMADEKRPDIEKTFKRP
jgi:hypothetical protein